MIIKKWLRPIASNAVALVTASILVTGFHVRMDPTTIMVGTVVLSLVTFFIKPVLKIISFPINIITLGFFFIVINAVLLYMTIYFVEGISVTAGLFSLNVPGLVIPEIYLSEVWTLVAASLVINVINWILEKILL